MDQYLSNQHEQHNIDNHGPTSIDSVSQSISQSDPAFAPSYIAVDQDLNYELEPSDDMQQEGGVPLPTSALPQQHDARIITPGDTMQWDRDIMVGPALDMPQHDHLTLDQALQMPLTTPVPHTNSAMPAYKGQIRHGKLPLLPATPSVHLPPYRQPPPPAVDRHTQLTMLIARTDSIITVMEEVKYTVGRYQWLKNAISRMKVLQNVPYLNAQSIQEIEQLEKFFANEAEMTHIADVDQMLRNKIKNLLRVRNAAMGEHAKSPEGKELKVKLLEEIAEAIFEE